MKLNPQSLPMVLLTWGILFFHAVIANASQQPNIILVMADDLGWGDVHYSGHPVLKTPNLNAMAAAGLRFDRFYAAAPVCSPTRGSCLTGRHPYRYGVFDAAWGHLPPEEITLAELLKQQGYLTGFFGKWHLGTLSRTRSGQRHRDPMRDYAVPSDHGFDEFFGTEFSVPTWDPMSRGYGVRNPFYRNGQIVTDNLEGDSSRVIMDRVIPFLRRAVKKKQKFLAVVWFYTPHEPVVAGPSYLEMYADVKEEKSRHYYGCITAMDDQIGRLRRELLDLGIADNTMLWFCSDNGPEGKTIPANLQSSDSTYQALVGSGPGSTGPFRGRKRDLFEGGIRVPGLLEWPAKVKPGSVTDAVVCTSDFLPTILDLLDLRMPDTRVLDGVSVKPVLDGCRKGRPQPIAFESRGMFALVDNRYKIVHVPRNVDKFRRHTKPASGMPSTFTLFDLLNDPGEKHDIAEEYPETVDRMVSQLCAWRESCQKSLQGHDYPSHMEPHATENHCRLVRVNAMLTSGDETVRIVCFGDSITGVYYHTGGRRAWCDMLGIALKKAYPAAKLSMVNAGISGNTSRQGIARIERDVIAHKPHVVVVAFGMNDARHDNRTPFRANLSKIVRRCQRAGAAVVLCTPNSVYPNQTRPRARIARFARTVRDVADEFSVPVADCFAAYEAVREKDMTEWMLLMSETIHPSMNGHRVFAEVIAATVVGKKVSLKEEQPPKDSLRFTFEQLSKNRPAKIVAMPPYDDILPNLLRTLFPGAQIRVTTWPSEGQSLAAIEEWSCKIRELKPQLVVVAIPGTAQVENQEAFIRSYSRALSKSLAYAHSQWDMLPILPSVTRPVEDQERDREELARRIILGYDVQYVKRERGDTRSTREIILDWINRQRERQTQHDQKSQRREGS